mmetsp:Transcript_49366/g.81231  ORF Transcript_49366/g.81231 Transcript_49366/m.81231 type:complete len:394 (+) Transcript_49366:3310-4491(+)
MDEHQICKVAKLSNGIIARHCSLGALSATDSNPNVCLQDHTDVVSTISDGQGNPAVFGFDQMYHISFLLWADTRTYYSHTSVGEAQHWAIVFTHRLLKSQGVLQRLPVNNQRSLHILRRFVAACLIQLALYIIPVFVINLLQRSFAIRCIARINGDIRKFDLFQMHLRVDQIACHGNVNGCFHLVTCQYPDLNSGVPQFLDGVWHSILQFVFNGCCSNQLQIFFDLLSNRIKFGISIHSRLERFIVPLVPFLVVLWREFFLGNHQRPQTFICKVSQMHLGDPPQWPRAWGHSLEHHVVSPFDKQHQLPLRCLDDAAHPFAGGIKFIDTLQDKTLLLPINHHVTITVASSLEPEALAFGTNDQRLFVGRAGLIHDILWRPKLVVISLTFTSLGL